MDLPVRKNHRLPAESYSSPDCCYFFTICTHDRSPLFTNHQLAQSIIESLLWRHHKGVWNLHCYCLMPDHLHIIVGIKRDGSQSMNAGARGSVSKGILDQIAEFKRYTAHLWHKSEEAGPLWQRSSFDSIIDQLELVDDLILYVLNNPVRKGLAKCWEDYPYCGKLDIL